MRIPLGAVALVYALSTAIACADDDQLSLGQAIARVLENNPQLQAADFDARAAAARIRQQTEETPWQLGVNVENVAGSGVAKGIDDAETTLSLGRVLELGGKAGLRGEVARLQAGQLRHEQDAERLDLLAEAASRFTALARVQAQRELAERQVELMRSTLRDVRRRVDVGKAPAAERSRVEIGLARAELALEETEHLLAVGRRQLAVLWGEIDADFSGVRADLMTLAGEPALDALEQALDSNPALARLATAERLADARLQLAQARRHPDWEVNAGVRHFNRSDDVGLMFSLRVPLGSAGRAAPYEEEARLLAEREPLLARDRRLALRATLFELYQELLHDRDRFETLRDRILPAAEQALADYTRGYNAGRYSLLELTQAQETLLQARREAIEAATDHHDNRIQIDRLIGTDPTTGAPR
ncbi:MAG: TolC family protein [Gammaproteobacteria bacterium]|nr:TolC family protein [Gammaproteobacteria bacterium]